MTLIIRKKSHSVLM